MNEKEMNEILTELGEEAGKAKRGLRDALQRMSCGEEDYSDPFVTYLMEKAQAAACTLDTLELDLQRFQESFKARPSKEDSE